MSEENHLAQHSPNLVNNIAFCYVRKPPTDIVLEKKQHFIENMEKHTNNDKVYTNGSKSKEKKVGFAAVFQDITKRGALP